MRFPEEILGLPASKVEPNCQTRYIYELQGDRIRFFVLAEARPDCSVISDRPCSLLAAFRTRTPTGGRRHAARQCKIYDVLINVGLFGF